MSLEDEIDELFTKAPGEFTAARNALAAKAKEAGRKDLAIRIGGLRKPTANVWLVNQIARRNPKQIAALLEAADELREAQAAALRGEGGESLQAASQAWRAIVKDLVKRGRAIADRFDDATIAATLFGASARPSHAKQLAEGTLVEEIEPPDFSSALGMSDGAPASRVAATPKKAEPERKDGRRETSERRKQEDEKRREREESEKEKARERELAEARREAERAAKAAARDDARAAELERRAKAATEEAEEARAEAEASQRSADELARRVRDLAAK